MARVAETGDSAAGLGDSAAETGDSAAGLGDSAAETGDSAAGFGDSAAGFGDGAAGFGDSAAGLGESAAETGDSAAGLGDSAAESGDRVAEAGDSAAGSGDSVPETGDRATGSGDSVAESGDSVAGTGDSVAEAGDGAGDGGPRLIPAGGPRARKKTEPPAYGGDSCGTMKTMLRSWFLVPVAMAGCASSAPNAVDAGGALSPDATVSDAAAAPLRRATVRIDGTTPKDVAPTFFGQNYWSWVKAWGAPVAAVQDATKALGVHLLRAGGANNDTQSPEPFSPTEIDSFVAYARAIGAEPLLQVPVIKNLSGQAPVPQDAADLVTYVNKTKSYGVQYFSIGNEPDLYVDQKLMASGYDAKAFCQTFRSYVEVMKAVDPSIKIVGPDLSWKYQSGANDWLTPFLQDCGSFVDVVAVHRYPLDPAQATAQNAYADDASYRQSLGHLRAILADTGQSAKPLAITEANVTWDGDPAKSTLSASPGTFPAALWLADNLGVSLENQLFTVSYWSLSEGWTLGFFDGNKPRPVYYAYQLFAKHFGEQVLGTEGAPSGVSVYAGRASGPARTTVFVINKASGPVELTLSGLPISAAPVLTVEAISMLVAELPDDGGATTLIRYSTTTPTPAVTQ